MASYNVKFTYYYPTLRYFIKKRSKKDKRRIDTKTKVFTWDTRYFVEWLIDIQDKKHPKMVFRLPNNKNRDEGALEWEDISYDEKHDLYYMRVIKLKYNDVPVTKTVDDDNHPSRRIPLNDDEFIGDFNLIVFDPSRNRVVVQQNSSGLSIGQIEYVLTSMVNVWKKSSNDKNVKDNSYVELKELSDDKKLHNMENSMIYRQFTIKCANVGKLYAFSKGVKSGTINQMIDLTKGNYGVSFHVTVSMSRSSKNNSLKRRSIVQMLKDVFHIQRHNNHKGINKSPIDLVIKSRKKLTDPLRNVDVLLPKLQSEISVVESPKNRTVGFDEMYNDFLDQNYLNHNHNMRDIADDAHKL